MIASRIIIPITMMVAGDLRFIKRQFNNKVAQENTAKSHGFLKIAICFPNNE